MRTAPAAAAAASSDGNDGDGAADASMGGSSSGGGSSEWARNAADVEQGGRAQRRRTVEATAEGDATDVGSLD